MKSTELKNLSIEEITLIEGGSLNAPILQIILDAINGKFTVWA